MSPLRVGLLAFVVACRGSDPGTGACDDVDAVCGPNATCSVVDGEPDCGCAVGYAPAADGCEDVDECATDNGGCGDPAYTACVNVVGAEPSCTDIDACATDNGGCGDARYVTCVDNVGAAPSCEDVDACATDNGGCGSATFWTCTDNDRTAPTCTDIDECATDNGGCGSATFWTCTDNDGAGPTCTDVDECAVDNGGCGNPTYWSCTDEVGAAPICADLDECAVNNGMCGPAAYWICTDNEGAAPTCTDIDECAVDNGGCGPAAYWTCTDVDGDVPICADIDECAVDNGGCGPAPYWTCTDVDGDVPTCADTLECASENGGCGDPAFFACHEATGGPATCSDAVCTTDGAVDPPGTACDGGACLDGACLPEVVVTTAVDLSTASITGRTCGDAPHWGVDALGGASATVTEAPGDCLAQGDEVLLISLQGTPTHTDQVGNWELLTVADVADATVTFTSARTQFYGAAAGTDAGVGTGPGDQKVGLFRVPAYDAVHVATTGSLTSAGWDGAGGGVLALRATLLRVDGTITASRLGYRSGAWSLGRQLCDQSVTTESGESITGPAVQSTTPNGGGAGGIGASLSGSYNGNTPICASAGHSQAGEPGFNGGVRTLGGPGAAYGVADGSRLTMGSGAAGNLTCDTVTGAPHLLPVTHTAAGIVALFADTLVVGDTGAITASAVPAGRDTAASGGYVLIVGHDVAVGTGRVTAAGGVGASGSPPTVGHDNHASPGYVVIDATGAVSGTTDPPATVLGP